jgi:uncharacterized RDD family membrane protein YckC
MEQNEFSIFSEREVKYGGFWIRFGAAFLDGLVLILPNYVVTFIVSKLFVISNLSTTSNLVYLGNPMDYFRKVLPYIITTNLITITIHWLYFAIQESGPSQATLGKRALKLKVTDMKGNRISFINATGRYFAKFLSGLTLLIGYIMAAFDTRNQALHDKMMGTLVESTD